MAVPGISGQFLSMARMSGDDSYTKSSIVEFAMQDYIDLDHSEFKKYVLEDRPNISKALKDDEIYFYSHLQTGKGISNPYKDGEILNINSIGDGTYSVAGAIEGVDKVTFMARVKQSEIRAYLRSGKPFPRGSLYMYE